MPGGDDASPLAPDTSPWGSVSSALMKLSPCAYRFRMGMVNPGLELVPGRKGRLPSACLVLPCICSGHFPPGPGPSRPLPRLKLAKPLVPGRGIQPLCPSQVPICPEAQGSLCPEPVLLPWDHCSGLSGLQRVTGPQAAGRVGARRLGSPHWHHHTQSSQRGPLHLAVFRLHRVRAQQALRRGPHLPPGLLI